MTAPTIRWALSPHDFKAHAVTGMPAAVTCPRCGMTSAHPTDVAEGYCGACHDWTSAPGSTDWSGGTMTARCGHTMPRAAGLDTVPRAALCAACVSTVAPEIEQQGEPSRSARPDDLGGWGGPT